MIEKTFSWDCCLWQVPRLSILLTVLFCSACGMAESTDESVSFCISRDMTDEPHFGCATRHNMAAQAANPDDLLGPRHERPRDAMRRDAILKNYTGSQTTKTQALQTVSTQNASTDSEK